MAEDTIWRCFECFEFLSSWFLKTTATGDEKTPERYLELAKRCVKQAQRISSRMQLKANFNHRQCKYLAEKLKLAVKSARSFEVNREYFFSEPESMKQRLEMFKLLLALSLKVENFILDCCKDQWIQAAVLSSNVSGHISSLGFHLELCTVLFNEISKEESARSSSLTKVDGISKVDAQVVKQLASLDKETLLRDLNAVREKGEKTSTAYQMAVLLLKRLERSRLMAAGNPPESSYSTLPGTVFSCVKQLQSLGRGSAATVYNATWHGTGVALKVFDGPNNSDFEKEISVLEGLSHPNIISVYCSTTGTHTSSIVMELMDKDLYSLIQARLTNCQDNQSPFGIVEAVDIMLQLGEGMSYLHEMRIVHRDLKSKNILVRSLVTAELEYVVAKVADFGLSKLKETSMTYTMQTLNMGTPRWMAPEMLADSEEMMIKHPFKCDIYSFGMVCYEILTGRLPFFDVTLVKDIKSRILKGERPKLPDQDQCPLLLKRLIEKCWSSDAGERPSFGYICTELRHLKFVLLKQYALGKTRLSDDDTGADEPVVDICMDIERSDHDEPVVDICMDIERSDHDEPVVDICMDIERSDHVKWLVGLDFGTTRSGFAYTYGSNFDQKCTVHYDYPSPSGREKPYCKTLTALYYEPVVKNSTGSEIRGLVDGKLQCESWGYHARSKSLKDRRLHKSPSQGAPQGFYLPNFKRFLRKDANDPFLTSSLPHPLTVDTIITDYLRHIGEYALERIKMHSGGKSLSKDSVKWCVTVPSIWEVNEKEEMIKECMVKAGLVSDDGVTESVKVILGPEAASFHCYRILSENHKDVPLHANDKILVVDIGGGTVDVVVQELVGREGMFKVREMMKSSCGCCGGISVDESFMNFVSKRVRCLKEYLESDDPSYRLPLLNRWDTIKCAFGLELMSESATENINLHTSLAEKWKAYETEHGYPQRESYFEIELSEKDLKSIFDPVVDRILGLIAGELNRVQGIKVMFVVGGFADSPYVKQRIRSRFSGEVDYIFNTNDPGSAMMEGAIALALTHDVAVVGLTCEDSES